jgi:glycosyltransferase involved in cell wall biosynthesis
MAFAYLFKSGRKERLEDDTMDGPTEFFFGYPQLRESDLDVDLWQDNDFGLDKSPSRLWRAVNHLAWAVLGLPLWAIYRLTRRDARALLQRYDAVFVTTNAFGIALALLQRLGLCRPRLIFVAIGLIDFATPKRILMMYRTVFRHVPMLSLGRPEVAFLKEQLPGIAIDYLPFGIDTRFWRPADTVPATALNGSYVLSIGNDRHRDYATLLRAWKPDYPRLKIVTKQQIPAASIPANVAVISGDWHQQMLSDEQIRTLMQDALFVVLPILDTIQPSGQSTCLQAMACGKAVIISDIKGIWDRDLMRDNENCLLVAPKSVADLQISIERSLGDSATCARLGASARLMVERELNIDTLSATVARLLNANTTSCQCADK